MRKIDPFEPPHTGKAHEAFVSPRLGRGPAQLLPPLAGKRCRRFETTFHTLPLLSPTLYPTEPGHSPCSPKHFDLFDKEFACKGPAWLYDAGIALRVLYMVIMAILMLNLLIAVRSMVHDTVHERTELEFNLARNQFIQSRAGVVARGHLPPPLNLLMIVISTAVDLTPGVILTKWSRVAPLRFLFRTTRSRVHAARFRVVVKEVLRRLLFALRMGILALEITALLWIVCLPSLAIGIPRWLILQVRP